MNVWAFIKHAEGRGDSTGRNDIIYIYPMVENPLGTETLNKFCPVKIDLEIPCGYRMVDGVKQWDCKTCRYNDAGSCDVIKYTAPEFISQGLFEMPLSISRRYKVELETMYTSNELELIRLRNKSQTQTATVMARAESKPQTKTAIKDKRE